MSYFSRTLQYPWNHALPGFQPANTAFSPSGPWAPLPGCGELMKAMVASHTFPPQDTVYEYFVDPKMRNWTSFEDKLPKSWRYPPK